MGEDFWFRYDSVYKCVDIVFKNSNYDEGNVFFHMVPISVLMEIKEKVDSAGIESYTDGTNQIDIQGESWSLFSRGEYILITFEICEVDRSFTLEMDLFMDVLSGYLEACRKWGIVT